MSELDPAEEKYPLLFLFLEDGQKSSKYKRIAFDKNRYKGITSGATAVINKWPGHLTTCWLTSVLIGLILLLSAMMIFAFSLRPTVQFLTLRCKGRHSDHTENYNTEVIHLIHTCDAWTEKQLDFLELIAQNYPQLTVDLIIIHNESNYTANHGLHLSEVPKIGNSTILPKNQTTSVKPTKLPKYKRNAVRNVRFLNPQNLQFFINIGAQSLLKLLLDKRSLNNSDSKNTPLTPIKNTKTFKKLLETFPNIKVTNTTLEKAFKSSPLAWTWTNLSNTTQLFALRVLQMWNLGGITFDIPRETTSLEFSKPQLGENLSFQKLISGGQTYFNNLPEGLVTVDNGGFHMETKTICHAFFGEMLVSLRRGRTYTLPEDVVGEVLMKFCRRGAVDAEYCQKIGFSRRNLRH